MLRISWTDYVSNDEVLEKIATRQTLILHIRKKLLKFLGNMRKAGLEKLILRGHIEGKTDRGKQLIAYLEILSKWMTEQDLGQTEKNIKFTRSYKGQGIVEKP